MQASLLQVAVDMLQVLVMYVFISQAARERESLRLGFFTLCNMLILNVLNLACTEWARNVNQAWSERARSPRRTRTERARCAAGKRGGRVACRRGRGTEALICAFAADFWQNSLPLFPDCRETRGGSGL